MWGGACGVVARPDASRRVAQDGGGIDRFEFVFGMILKLQLLEQKDIDPFIKQVGHAPPRRLPRPR